MSGELQRIYLKALKDGAYLAAYHPPAPDTGNLYLYLITDKSRHWAQEWQRFELMPNVHVLVGSAFLTDYRRCF